MSIIDEVMEERGTTFYGGRSPYQERLYGFDSTLYPGGTTPTKNSGFLGDFSIQNPNSPNRTSGKRNFSALDYGINPSVYSATYGSLPNYMNPNMMNVGTNSKAQNVIDNTEENYLRASGLIDQVGTRISRPETPGKKVGLGQGLLNFAQSPFGTGFASGLLKGSGYSPRPISFGEALGMAMQGGQESQAAFDQQQLQREKFAYEQERDVLNRALAYAQIKPASVPAIQQNIRSILESQGIMPGTPEYQKEFARLLTEYIQKTPKTDITVQNQAEDKGDAKMFELAAVNFDESGKKLTANSETAITQNQNIDAMLRLVNTMSDGDFGTFGLTKLQLEQFGKQLGLNPENIDNKEVFFTLAGNFVMGQIAKTKGAISNKEMAYFEMISPGLSRSKAGNILQLKLAKAVNDWHIDLAERRSKWELKNQGLNSVESKNKWNEEYFRILQEENTVLDAFDKAIEQNLMNNAIEQFGKENLLYDYQNQNDFNIMKGMIETYYGDQSSQIKDYQLVGYQESEVPEVGTVYAPQIMVTLDDGQGNERYEIRTILRKQ
ncbi:hypothetical protein [uncultured Mediterranean phage uvMED]|nr:hypothetical protein [uncultured Mediterranean phage uvMED]